MASANSKNTYQTKDQSSKNTYQTKEWAHATMWLLLANQTFYKKKIEHAFQYLPKTILLDRMVVFKNTKRPHIGEVYSSKKMFCLSWEFFHKHGQSSYQSESFVHINLFNALGSFCSCWMSIHAFWWSTRMFLRIL